VPSMFGTARRAPLRHHQHRAVGGRTGYGGAPRGWRWASGRGETGDGSAAGTAVSTVSMATSGAWCVAQRISPSGFAGCGARPNCAEGVRFDAPDCVGDNVFFFVPSHLCISFGLRK